MALVEDPVAQAAAMNQGLAAALAERNRLQPAPTVGTGTFSTEPAPDRTAAGPLAADYSKMYLVDPRTGKPPDPNTTRTNANGQTFDKATGAYLMLELAGGVPPPSPPIPGMADEYHGGFAPGTYHVNPDGTLTILKVQPLGRNTVHPGDTVNIDGSVVGIDGKARVEYELDQNGNIIPGSKPTRVYSVLQPDGKPATANPNYYGESVFTNDSGTGLVDELTKDVEKLPGVKDLVNTLSNTLSAAPGTPVDTGAISAASARSAALSDQFNSQYQNFQDRAAPVAQSQQIGDVVNAQTGAPVAAGLAQSQQIGSVVNAQTGAPVAAGQANAGFSNAAQIAGTALAGQQAPLSEQQIQAALAARQQAIAAPSVSATLTPQQQALLAQQVTAAQQGRTALGPTALAGGTQLGPSSTASMTGLAPAALANAAAIDTSQQGQFRADQRGLVTGLQGAIAGTDPSVAALMLRQATERNVANQFALAKASSGMNAGLAQRQAMIGAADINQQAIGQQALLRAQEIAAARGQLGGVLDQGRSQDLTLAGQQAQLAQQTTLANQGALNTSSLQQGQLDVQTKLANAGFLNTANMTQAQLAQALQLANAGFKNTATTTQAQLDAAQASLNTQAQNTVGLANAANSLEAGKTNVTLAQQAALANAAAQNTAAQANQSATLDASKTNATLAQQVALANAASQNTAAQANQSANLEAQKTSLTLAQQVALANAGAQNQTSQQNATMANASNLANAQNLTQTSIANAGNTTGANTASAQLANQVALANAAAGNQVNQTNAQLGTQTAIANAGNTTSANTASAQLANQVALANAAAGNQVNQTNAQLGTQTNIANAGNATTTAGQNIAEQNNLAQNALTGSGQAITGAVGAANAQAEQAKAEAAKQAAILGAGATAGAALLSDRRAKKNITDGGAETQRFLDALEAYGFDYKNPRAPGAAPGRRTGIMVQDLERSSLGRSLVRETPAGKAVDVNQATGAALAALAQINQRLSKVEGRT